MGYTINDGHVVPAYSVLDRSRTQNNGIVSPMKGYLIISGSVQTTVAGGQSEIVTKRLNTFAFELKRVEVFHSGSAVSFGFSITNVSGSSDPLAVIADYQAVPGSDDFSGGMDQVEQLLGVASQDGRIYLNFTPNLNGNNHFKYLIFIEPALVYIDKDNNL